MILERHRSNPYDCIFQFSQVELLKLARHAHELPPIVIYPCSHAAGELRWHRRESAYALKSERVAMHYAVRSMLRFRAAVQRRQLQKPAMIIGPSNRFNQLLSTDYDIPPDRFRVLYHPIREASDGSIQVQDSKTSPTPMKLLFVGRISVRKGFEQIVELSHRLDDAFGQIEIQVIGDKTQWSDYTGHINELNSRIAKYVGSVKHRDMASLYDSADILLIPSMYEPGPLVLGEGISRGLSVVASDEVGAAEPVSRESCRRFPAGDVAAFEAAVRQLIKDLRTDRVRLRRLARQEAKKHFAPQVISEQLFSFLKSAAVCRDSIASSVDQRAEPMRAQAAVNNASPRTISAS